MVGISSYLYVSPSVERLRGYTPEELLSQRAPQTLDEGEAARVLGLTRARAAAFRAGETTPETFYSEELQLPCKDGSTVWAEVITSYYVDEESGRVQVRGVTRDVTERKRAEAERSELQERLQQAQKMESIGRLAGGVAHDFNNMLAVILGYAELAENQVEPSTPLRRDLEQIRKAAGRSADLTRQLLAFARKQAVVPKVIDLNEAVAGMTNMLRRLIGENVQLRLELSPQVWPVEVDPSQVDQVLANLCVNARDAIRDVGTVRIETANVTLEEGHRGSDGEVVAGEFVRVTVRDDGCGMDGAVVAHLFEPFFTTKEVGKGTGLGLATIYGILKQNRGFVEVRSEPGVGSTFAVHLPRKADAPRAKAWSSAPAATPKGRETILLVEDEPELLKLTKRLLERLGYTVLASLHAKEAIELAHAHAGRIDLLLTDVIMPALNGRDLAERLLADFPRMKRLFMSGYAADVVGAEGLLDDRTPFLTKPFSNDALAIKVRAVLDADPAEPAEPAEPGHPVGTRPP